MAITNRFAGKCNNPLCTLKKNVYNGVAAGEGFATKINDKWVTWCKECVPVQKVAAEAVRRVLTADGKIYLPGYEPASLPLLKSLKGPGGVFGPKFNGSDKSWSVSLDPADRQRLLEVADRLKLEVAPSLRTAIVTEQAQNALHAGLYPFQVQGVNWMSKRKKALLGDDMGLGKTVQALISLPAEGKGLIVAPAGLKYNWQQEASVWRPDLKVVVLKGGTSFRFPVAGELVVTNYDILADFLDPTPKVKGAKKAPKMPWSVLKVWREQLKAAHPDAEGVTVIFDEAHKAKNYKTERSRKVRELSRLCSKVWGLTGTPLDNKPEDLFGVLDSLDMAFDVFTPSKGQSPFDKFQQLFGAQEGRFGVRYGPPAPEVPELLRRVMLRRTRPEVLPDLPRKTYTNYVVGEMDAATRRQLDEMWAEDGTALELDGALPPFEKMSEIRAKLAKSNIPAMLEYIENAEEQDCPLVVFSSHLAPLDELLGRPGWAVINGSTSPEKRQEIVNAFQSGVLKGVALTIRAGGVGLTLTHAWKVLFVDLDWVPGWNSQAEDRVCRIGQTSNKVEIVRMVNDHPLTMHILNTLVEKAKMVEAAVERKMAVEITAPARTNSETETQEEFDARMARIEAAQKELETKKVTESAEQAKSRAKGKVDLIHGREKARNSRPILPLTEKRVGVVRESFKFMLSVCDGAHSKDGQGFNKPDAVVAHWLLTAGLETPKEVEAAYYMLVRYHRQLSGSYPVLFAEVK